VRGLGQSILGYIVGPKREKEKEKVCREEMEMDCLRFNANNVCLYLKKMVNT
jgi:hypothetical protein